jgi:serine/threonine protein kinase/Tol biopolymer transport system component
MDRQATPMTAEKWMQLKRIFDAAQSKAPQERAELVRAMAEGDQELELAVRDLLAADESAGIFLQTPAAALHSPLLAPGARLGPYQILGLLSEGGMGEVYRAKDTRLERTVAIKILREHLSGNPQLRERFEREARAISSLSHPHICPLYDVGHQDGIDYLVMEYLEGETLASRLKKGPLPVDQMLQYAIQITDALDTAHKHGVIHRDLKPGNIMLTKNGARLLDFGLAKVRAAEAAAGMTALPTQAAPLTGEGTILGTLQYMAPEQLEGGEADARTDIFALGAVIYEMATGRKAFDSKSQASQIAAILEREPPPISTIQPVAPRALDHVVRFCLAKQPEDRWQTSHDVLLQLKWIAGNGAVAQTTAPAAVGSFHKRGRLGWIVAACLSLALIALALAHFHEKPSDLHPIRFQIPTPDKVTLSWIDIPVVSPDGRRLVFTATTAAGERLLWIRNLDTLAAEALPGTEGASFPFWSPDSRFVAFLSLDKLNKIDLSDGSVQTLCHIPGNSGSGDWNQDGVILFSTPGPLLRVSAEGGEPQPVLELNKSRRETSQRWPHFMPDGRHFLYLAGSADAGETGIFAGSLNSGQTQLVMHIASNVSYIPFGFLIYGRQQTLLAQKFDAKTLQVSGKPIPIAQQLDSFRFISGFPFSVSQNGVLAYRSGSSGTVQLAWYNRDGKRVTSIGDPGLYSQIVLSPDEKRLAVERVNSNIANLWILELASGILSRATFNPAGDVNPVWSPDGRELLFSSRRNGHLDLYRKSIGGGEDELIYHSDEDKGPYSWTKDGWILFNAGPDLYRVPLTGEREPVAALKSEGQKDLATVPQDGRWVAYESNESGRWEVYLASYPAFGGRRQVSSAGGSQPLWVRDGKELFYLTLDSKLAVVEVKGGATLEAGVPQVLFRTPVRVNPNQTEYVVTGDGQRFIFREPIGETVAPTTVVLNWTAELNR